MHGTAIMGPGPGYEKHPEHTVDLKPDHRRVCVRFNGTVVADTRDAIMVYEAGYEPVAYIPRADVRMELLSESDRETHCPFKGYASYWSVTVEGRIAENAAWAYPRSYEEVTDLAECIAFDKRLVDEVVTSEH